MRVTPVSGSAISGLYASDGSMNIVVANYGAVGDGVTDDTTALQDAIDEVSTSGGGTIILPAGTFMVTTLNMYTGVELVGQSRNGTIIKQIAGTDGPVIQTFGFAAMLGSGSVSGNTQYRFKIANLTVDGNKDNQSAGADVDLQNGISIYGYDFQLENVRVLNAYGHGIRTAVGPEFGSAHPSGSSFEGVYVFNANRHGIWFAGSSDSVMRYVKIKDASQEADDTYDGLHISDYNLRGFDIHVARSSGATNRVRYPLYDDGNGSCEFVACHFEGGRKCAYFGARMTRAVSSYFYQNSDTNPMLLVNANGVLLTDCRIDANASFAAPAVQIGNGAAVNNCKLSFSCDVQGAENVVVFDTDGGQNVIDITAYDLATSGLGYSGTLSKNSELRIRQTAGDGGVLLRTNINPTINLRTAVTWTDDFFGDVLSDEWSTFKGSNGAAVVATVTNTLQGGAARMTAGSDAAGTLATNGTQLNGTTQWIAGNGGLSMDICIKLQSSIADVALFFGFTDQSSALEMPLYSAASADTITSDASNAVGVMFDTAMATDNWWLVGVKADTDATHQNSAVAPVVNTYEHWTINVSSAGHATFYRNGVQVGTALQNAISAASGLAPVVVAFSRAAATKVIDVDYVSIKMNRA